MPPVETSSTPRSTSPRAKSAIPVLSETDSTARAIRTSPGWVTPSLHRRGRYVTAPPATRRGCPGSSVTAPRAISDDRLAQQVVLERAQRVAHGSAASVGAGQLDRPLGDDPARVDALVDEVDGDTEHLHAVVERLLDRADAGEGGQQRRVHVDHARRRSARGSRVEQLHVAGEHDELDAVVARATPPSRRRAPRGPGCSPRFEHRDGDAGRPPRARAPVRAGLSEPTATTSTPSRPWTRSRMACRFVPAPEASTPTRSGLTAASRHLQLREAPAGRAQGARRRPARRRARARPAPQVSVGAVVRQPVVGVLRAPPSSARRAGSRPPASGRPRAVPRRPRLEDRLVERTATSPAATGRCASCAGRPEPAAPRRAGGSGSAGTQLGVADVAARARSGAGAERSPKWRRMPSRRQRLALDPRPHGAVLAPARPRALLGRRAAGARARRGPARRRAGP